MPGTDQLRRDTFSRLIHGGRISLLVGFAGVLISAAVGAVLGVPAGFILGWTDRMIMRLPDIQLAFPRILLAVSIFGVHGAHVKNLVIVVGSVSVATNIILEPSLSFLGVGAGAITWGTMMADARRSRSPGLAGRLSGTGDHRDCTGRHPA